MIHSVVSLLLMLLLFSTIRADGLKDVFIREIPEQIKSRERFLSSLEKNMEKYGRLDPALIYPYLEYLRLKFDAGVPDKDNNFLWYFNARVNKRVGKRGRWLEATIDSLRMTAAGKGYVAILEELANGDAEQRPVNRRWHDRPANYDQNREAYMAWLFLGRASGQKYEREKNYKSRVDSLWRIKVRACEEVYGTLADPDRFSREAKEKAVRDYLQVFRDSYLEDIPKTPFTLLEFARLAPKQTVPDYLITMGKKYLNSRDEQKMSITAGFTGRDLINGSIPSRTFTDPFGSEFEFSLDDKMTQKKAPWQIGLTIPLRQYTGLFSHIRVNYGYAENQYTFSGETLVTDTISYYQYPNYRITGSYFKTQQPSKTFRMTRVQLMTPILYLFNSLILEAGATLKKAQTTIRYGLYFDGTVAVSPWTEVDEFYNGGEYQDKVDMTLYTVEPTISLKYIMMDYLLLQADYHFNNGTGRDLILGVNLRYPVFTMPDGE